MFGNRSGAANELEVTLSPSVYVVSDLEKESRAIRRTELLGVPTVIGTKRWLIENDWWVPRKPAGRRQFLEANASEEWLRLDRLLLEYVGKVLPQRAKVEAPTEARTGGVRLPSWVSQRDQLLYQIKRVRHYEPSQAILDALETLEKTPMLALWDA